MRSWTGPDVPDLRPVGPPVRVHDTASGGLVTTVPDDGVARLYVCGITPYDATHMGHASTYVAFDLLNRAWRSAGHRVIYVQNVTDVDDPLLERADRDGIHWQDLAEREVQLFRDDMAALRVLPPDHYEGVVESIPLVIDLIHRMDRAGAVYRVDDDLYQSVTADPAFGAICGWDRDEMLRVFAERGGDPERPGKRDPLDCLLWRAERPGEPAWESPFGRGRPGWHVECAAIATEHHGTGFDVQGGGSDLVFPHHEMSAGEVHIAFPGERFAKAYTHAGMVAYEGEKMSKSLGNLVLVSRLRAAGVDPMAVRLTLLRHHYRSDWEWTDESLQESVAMLGRWRTALNAGAGPETGSTVTAVLEAMADDLDAPRAVQVVDDWVARALSEGSGDAVAAHLADVIDAALGISV